MYTCEVKQQGMTVMNNDSDIHRDLFNDIAALAASDYRYHHSWFINEQRKNMQDLTACYDAFGIKDMNVRYVSHFHVCYRCQLQGKLFTPVLQSPSKQHNLV